MRRYQQELTTRCLLVVTRSSLHHSHISLSTVHLAEDFLCLSGIDYDEDKLISEIIKSVSFFQDHLIFTFEMLMLL